MKFRLLFTTIVWTAFVTLFLVRRGATSDPYEGLEFGRLEAAPLPVLETPTGPHRLSGLVIADLDTPASDVLVELFAVEPARDVSPWSTRTGPDGRFVFEHLPAGRYAAQLVRAGTPPIRYETDVPGEARWRLPLPYENPGTIPPLVTSGLEGTIAPPVGWSLEVHPLEEFEVALVPSDDSDPLSGAVTRRVRADADGRFVVPELVHGTYDLYVLPPWAADGDWPRLCEESRRHGDAERAVNLRLRSGGIDVVVVAADGAPVRGAMVEVSPREAPERIWPLATTGEDGAAGIEHLPPGVYRVRVHAGEHAADRDVEVRIGQRADLAVTDFDRPPAQEDDDEGD